MINIKKTLLSLLLAGFASFSQAITIDFNDVWMPTAGKFTISGFEFLLAGHAASITDNPRCYYFSTCPLLATPAIVVPFGSLSHEDGNDSEQSGSVTLSQSKRNNFQLIGFDATAQSNFNDGIGIPSWTPKQINVVGFTGSDWVYQSFIFNTPPSTGPMSLQTFKFDSSFTGLKFAIFTSGGSSDGSFNGFVIDNLEVAQVPEPKFYAMLLGGLALLRYMARRSGRVT